MAQFPSQEIAQLSYEFRTLGLGYANIGGLLMAMGLAYDSDEGRAFAARPDRDHDRRRLCHLGRDGGRARRLPRLCAATARRCCGSSATIAAPPMARPRGYEGLSVLPVPLDAANCPEAAWSTAAAGLGRGAGPGRAARLSQRPGDGDRADRHDRPGDGLRHHRASSPTSPWSSSRSSPAAAISRSSTAWCRWRSRPWATARRRSRRSSAMPSATARWRARPGVNHAALRAKGFTAAALQALEDALAAAFDINFAFNNWTLGEEFCTKALGFTAGPARRRRASTCWRRWASARRRSRPPTPIAAAP